MNPDNFWMSAGYTLAGILLFLGGFGFCLASPGGGASVGFVVGILSVSLLVRGHDLLTQP